MIARVEPPFRPSEPQKRVKKILEEMTGLKVRIVPFTAPIEEGIATVNYVFKCAHDKNDPPEKQAAQTHALHDYIRHIMMDCTGSSYEAISIAIIADPDEPRNSMWPCVSIRLSNMMGMPYSDTTAPAVAMMLQQQLMQHLGTLDTNDLKNFHAHLRKMYRFKDAYAQKRER